MKACLGLSYHTLLNVIRLLIQMLRLLLFGIPAASQTYKPQSYKGVGKYRHFDPALKDVHASFSMNSFTESSGLFTCLKLSLCLRLHIILVGNPIK